MPPPHTIMSLLLLLFLLPANGAATPALRHRDFAHRDLARHRSIISRRRNEPPRAPGRGALELSRKLCEGGRNGSIWLPLYSAADYGVGEYLAEVEVGTPPRKLKLFADTGSDLTWVKCEYHSRGRDRMRRRVPVFQADRSATFHTVPCGSRECSHDLSDLFSITTCPSPTAPCLYNYRYQDESLVVFGIFGNETITLRHKNHDTVSLRSIIGCTLSMHGSTNMNGGDGVLGLSNSKESFAYRMATKYGGGKFSYCLVDHLSTANVTNFLVFGDRIGEASIVGNIRHTKLFLHAIHESYAVSVMGISVGGSMLEVPPAVWDLHGLGGTILDSGTSLTVLATPAYRAVMEALTRALTPRFPSIGQGSDLQPFSYCFNSTGFKESMVPRLVIHFSDGARFQPHVKSYIIDDEPQVKCVGILEGPGTPYSSIIGNILQQNFLWEYDLYSQKLAFGASTCTSIS